MLRRIFFTLTLLTFTATLAQADLAHYLSDLDALARKDMNHFSAQLGVHFGLSNADLELVFRTVDGAAEAAVVLWLGERSRKSLDTVLETYRTKKTQGWGAMAKSLGIKPGSAEFHALKQGNLGWYPASGSDTAKSTGSGKDKGKGKGKK